MAEIHLPVDMVNIPIIYRVSYIPGGCLGFQPSTVSPCFFLPKKIGAPAWCCGTAKRIPMSSTIKDRVFERYRVCREVTYEQ